MTRVLVTGANGFVGSALCERLSAQGTAVRAVARTGSPSRKYSLSVPTVGVGDIHAGTDWSVALAGATHVVHLAARVHVVREVARDPLADFRAVNTAGTVNLARQAATAGVRRFVYVSTIKVNGERTSGQSFRADDNPQPEDAYALSKIGSRACIKRNQPTLRAGSGDRSVSAGLWTRGKREFPDNAACTTDGLAVTPGELQ